MNNLEFKTELDLDSPNDVDWLCKWDQNAQEYIKILETKLNKQNDETSRN